MVARDYCQPVLIWKIYHSDRISASCADILQDRQHRRFIGHTSTVVCLPLLALAFIGCIRHLRWEKDERNSGPFANTCAWFYISPNPALCGGASAKFGNETVRSL